MLLFFRNIGQGQGQVYNFCPTLPQHIVRFKIHGSNSLANTQIHVRCNVTVSTDRLWGENLVHNIPLLLPLHALFLTSLFSSSSSSSILPPLPFALPYPSLPFSLPNPSSFLTLRPPPVNIKPPDM